MGSDSSESGGVKFGNCGTDTNFFCIKLNESGEVKPWNCEIGWICLPLISLKIVKLAKKLLLNMKARFSASNVNKQCT